MRRDQHDPLPFELWLAELGKLAEACALHPAEHEDRAVRRAFYLFQLAPPSIRALADPDLEESAVELLLERGEAERAARLIVGPRASVTWERPSGALHHVAWIAFADELSACGAADSPALALIRAWAELFRKTPERALARLSVLR